MIRKTFLHLHWMPTTVFLIGMLSISLLWWVNRINEQQRVDYARVDMLKDMQIRATAFHLWLEESLIGDPNKQNIENFWKDLQQFDRLLDIILHGGKADDGTVLGPLRDQELRRRAETLRPLLVRFKALSQVRLRNRGASGVGSESDQRFDDTFMAILSRTRDMEVLVEAEKARNRTTSMRLVTGVLLTWTFIVIAAALGILNREQRRNIAEKKLLTANEQLLCRTEELKTHREHLADQVEMRTQELTSANKSLELEIDERRKAEAELTESRNQLRHLSSSILSAQEEERTRISRELHDGLGQSLTLMKIQLRSVVKRLRKDQETLREDCEGVLRQMNAVIEDVRRLSKDLRPFILDDLGLTRALVWLVDNFSKNGCNIRLVTDLPDFDHVFSQQAQTCIYRIMQEALTNITKHSGAGSASISIRRAGEAADFSIEDEGSGFDMAGFASRNAGERGLGLASMEERVRTLGGSFTLTSEPGKGTRISFSIPVSANVEPPRRGDAEKR